MSPRPKPIQLLYRLYCAARVRVNPVDYFRSRGAQIGDDCHLWGFTVDTLGPEPYLVRLGHNVSIAHGSDFLTHDDGIERFRAAQPGIELIAPIVIGDDVFAGAHTIFLPGTTIGARCIIAAGSVVQGTFAPDSLIVGHPARRVGSVQDYWERTRAKTVPSYLLNREAKRKFLEAALWATQIPAEPAEASQ